MDPAPPTSVVLPTRKWTDACTAVASQLGPDDELLLVCDDESDPVAARVDSPEGNGLPAGVRVISAGEPVGCSGKANAIAAGMEAARHDRIVWTDDDFHHPPDWLARLHADYNRHGPVTELPFFVGRDPLALLVEPQYVLGGTFGIYVGKRVWAGAVLFDRADLERGLDHFLAELRRTVSDDGLLSEHLDVTPLRRTRRVEIGGSIRETLERHVRFVQIVWRHDPRGTVIGSGIGAGFAVGSVAFPVPALVLSTLLAACVYAAVGVRRWTFLLAYPAVLTLVPLLAYGLARRTFVWGGRRYRWRSLFDVTVVE